MKEFINISGNEFLEIDVSYNIGGYNCERGIHAHLTKVTKEQYSGYSTYSMVVFEPCNFWFEVKQLKRKSQKEIENAFNKIISHKSELLELFKQGNKQGIIALCKN